MAMADRRMPRLKAVRRRGAACDACLRSVEGRKAISLPRLGRISVFAYPVSSTQRDRDQSPGDAVVHCGRPMFRQPAVGRSAGRRRQALAIC